jgi:hypothetical protein
LEIINIVVTCRALHLLQIPWAKNKDFLIILSKKTQASLSTEANENIGPFMERGFKLHFSCTVKGLRQP